MWTQIKVPGYYNLQKKLEKKVSGKSSRSEGAGGGGGVKSTTLNSSVKSGSSGKVNSKGHGIPNEQVYSTSKGKGANDDDNEDADDDGDADNKNDS